MLIDQNPAHLITRKIPLKLNNSKGTRQPTGPARGAESKTQIQIGPAANWIFFTFHNVLIIEEEKEATSSFS